MKFHDIFKGPALCLLLLMLFCGCGKKDVPKAETSSGNTAGETALKPERPTEKTDFSLLQGKWQRPDGGYVLSLSNPAAGGGIDASYFNPRPVNVSKSRWSRENAVLQVFVELRDTNYPGATYLLIYNPESDVLYGKYHQPLHSATYDIYFIRIE